MHIHDNDAFDECEPTAKHVFRIPKYPIGIHERWSGDRHNKLYKISFPVWAMVDDAMGKWLGAWVVPSNRMGEIVTYLFLCLVESTRVSLCIFMGIPLPVSDATASGMPLQSSTDCGSETTKLYGLAMALQ